MPNGKKHWITYLSLTLMCAFGPQAQGAIGFEVAPALDLNQMTMKEENQADQKRWALGFGLEVPMNSFTVSNNALDSDNKDPLKEITYHPSFNPVGVFKIGFDQWGLEYSRKLAVENQTMTSKYGPTEFDSFRLNLLYQASVTEVYFQNYKGLYTDIDVTDHSEQIIQRPDLKFQNFGLQTLYGVPFWNSSVPNSIYAFSGKPELLKTEEWSFDMIFGGNLNHLSLNGDGPFVPKERMDYFGEASSLSGVVSDSAGLGIGLGASVAPSESSLVSFMALLAGNVQRSRIEFADSTENVWGAGHHVSARFKWGYYGEQSSFALKCLVDTWQSSARNVDVMTAHTTLGLDYSYKF